ncbi:MAG: cation:proton antiporter [Planctomycetota bacterium]|nr:cation:proton antiporter [Planctomycetota bacterium]
MCFFADASSENSAHLMLQTIVAAIAGGVLLIVLARKLQLPAIVLLLGGGFLLGPALWGDAAIVQPDSLGEGMRVIVSLAIGLILFEGGLTLDLSGYRSAPSMIKRLLTLGVAITWMGIAFFVWLIFDLPFTQAVLAGSLVIVTGPTVIAPLLKRIKIEERLNSILHWEGVLIDPIGVFLAILCFEAFAGDGGQAAFINLLVRVLVGLPLGIGGGLILSQIVKRRWIDEEMLNVFSLASAVLIFGLAEAVLPETGLLSVTVAGFVFGLSGTAQLKQVRQFKGEITDLLIGTLFILLAARLEPGQFMEDFGLKGVGMVAIVILVIRPLSVFCCAWGGDLKTREKLFLSWVAPRGIVAASLASLVAIRLTELGTIEHPRFVETFAYSVIIATIVLQGSTAGLLARLLRLKRLEPTGWMIVGAHTFARGVAKFMNQHAKLKVVMVDTNPRRIDQAKKDGLIALARDARDIKLTELPILQGIGNVLALTDNEDLNLRICRNWAEVFGAQHVFRYDPSAPVMEKDFQADEHTMGRIVWARLARPNLLSGELSRAEAKLIDVDQASAGQVSPATPLVVFAGDELVLDPGEKAVELLKQEGAKGLFLRREADYLQRSLRRELFITSKATTLQELFEEMMEPLVKLNPQLPREETIQQLVDRELAFPTALGHGVATPHAYGRKLDVRLCAIARIPKGLDYGARDGEPVRLVFLLLSPPGDPEGHLATLGEIARLMINPHIREKVLAASNADEFMDLLGITPPGE